MARTQNTYTLLEYVFEKWVDLFIPLFALALGMPNSAPIKVIFIKLHFLTNSKGNVPDMSRTWAGYINKGYLQPCTRMQPASNCFGVGRGVRQALRVAVDTYRRQTRNVHYTGVYFSLHWVIYVITFREYVSTYRSQTSALLKRSAPHGAMMRISYVRNANVMFLALL